MPELVVLTEQLLAAVPGGTGRYTRSLTEALARTAPPGWTVAGAVARHADVTAARIDGVAGPRVLPVPPRALVAAWRHGLRLWPGGDVLHAPTPLAPPWSRRGRALVVTVHDTVPWTHPETLTPRGAAWHRAVIERAMRAADTVLVPTHAVAAELPACAGGDTPVRVVGHGAAGPAIRPGTPIAGEPPLPDRYVLAVGTIEPRKGLATLVAAMASGRAPDVPLVVVGQQGWGGVDLPALARENGLAPDRLLLLGSCSDAVLSRVLRGASVLAAPSLAEGFGLPLLEAMAAGVPIVHSDAPALVEVAGGAGTTVPRRDPGALAAALAAVVSDPVRRGRMVELGKARAARFEWESAARQTWRVHLDCYQAAR